MEGSVVAMSGEIGGWSREGIFVHIEIDIVG